MPNLDSAPSSISAIKLHRMKTIAFSKERTLALRMGMGLERRLSKLVVGGAVVDGADASDPCNPVSKSSSQCATGPRVPILRPLPHSQSSQTTKSAFTKSLRVASNHQSEVEAGAPSRVFIPRGMGAPLNSSVLQSVLPRPPTPHPTSVLPTPGTRRTGAVSHFDLPDGCVRSIRNGSGQCDACGTWVKLRNMSMHWEKKCRKAGKREDAKHWYYVTESESDGYVGCGDDGEMEDEEDWILK
ncbi:hypothetical protein EXIGLDRAFT_769438 [Exidia glandulosa HHB12029]|uniref:Uncharacterized protein n=1 Tax=Exidia glandulosa HHB12029 TaxID=1314781 RepID=A0A165HGL5_EXIGL|nr:hypothetical protein EXIGLDRAFT_769438 [Exidia glandulosa HHB12029]